MTNETEYGPEIVVDGVRPEWLRDDETILCNGPRTAISNLWAASAIIRLPASHPYYTVLNHNAKHGTQFKYWPGGECPADYDGGDVLCRDGWMGDISDRLTTFGDEEIWEVVAGYNDPADIIGYTPKPCADAIDLTLSKEAQAACEKVERGNAIPFDANIVEAVRRVREDIEFTNKMERIVQAQNPQPDFVPCERTVRLCIEKVRNAFDSRGQLTKMDSVFVDGYRTGLDALEALLPKKDRAEELVDGWCMGSNFDRDREVLEPFTRWLIAQGEIRG